MKFLNDIIANDFFFLFRQIMSNFQMLYIVLLFYICSKGWVSLLLLYISLLFKFMKSKCLIRGLKYFLVGFFMFKRVMILRNLRTHQFGVRHQFRIILMMISIQFYLVIISIKMCIHLVIMCILSFRTRNYYSFTWFYCFNLNYLVV